MARLILPILLFLFPSICQGQVDVVAFPESASKEDSLVEAALLEAEKSGDTTHYRKRKYRLFNPLLNMDNNRSGFFGTPTSVWGARVGVTIAGRYRMGFGGYMLPRRIAIPKVFTLSDSLYRRMDLMYFTTFMEFVPIQNFRWELSIPFSFGYGFSNFYHRYSTELEFRKAKLIHGAFLHSGVAGHYKIFSWVGLGIEVGYRGAIMGDSIANRQFSGLFGSVAIKLFLGDLYLGIFKPDIIKGEKMAYRDNKRRKKAIKKAKREAGRLRREADRK